MIPLYWVVAQHFLLLRSENCKNTNERFNNEPTSGNVIINDCVFSRTFSFSGDGGIFCFVDLYVNLNVYDSTFFDCSSQYHYGVIRARLNTIIWERVCLYNCFTGYGHSWCIGYIETINSYNNMKFNMLSFSKCPSNSNEREKILTLRWGSMYLYNVNSSNNERWSLKYIN